MPELRERLVPVQDEPSLLVENGEWRRLGDVIGTNHDPERAKIELMRIGVKLKKSLGLREVPFEFRNGHLGLEIRSSGLAGTVSVSEIVLDVAPKFFPQGSPTAEWDASLLMLMQQAGRKHIAFNRSKRVASERHSFVDLLGMAFLDAVALGLTDQPIQTYRTRAEQLPVLRGRLNLARQLRSVFTRPQFIECDVDQLDTLNEFNGLIKWAAVTFAASVRSPGLRRKLIDIAQLLHGPPNRTLAMRGGRIEPPPQFRIWSEALEIAALLSSGLTHTSHKGIQQGYSFAFNMEKLFEHFVALSLHRVPALLETPAISALSQDRVLYALPGINTSKAFYSKPDNVLRLGARTIAVVDAKYKRLSDTTGKHDRRPGNQDIYELVAAMTAQKCAVGMLVYPRVIGDTVLIDNQLRTWIVDGFGTKLHIGAIAVDLMTVKASVDLRRIDSVIAVALTTLLNLRDAA